MKQVEVHSDGACLGNPGPGGWGALLRYGSREKELSGGEPDSTNNRMELTAVIEALKCLNVSCRVDLYSDSAYVVNAFKENWLTNWKRKGWKNASGAAVSNQDLWMALDELTARHQMTWHKVKGHADNPYNNRCDELAVQAAAAAKASMSAAD